MEREKMEREEGESTKPQVLESGLEPFTSGVISGEQAYQSAGTAGESEVAGLA